MMKTKRIPLTSWVSDQDNIDIDWPRVQRDLGLNQVEWLLKQSHDECQLFVDKSGNDFTLTAEFYTSEVLLQYHLMWSKA